MNDNEKLKDILFLSKRTLDADLNKIRKSIEHAVDREKYGWKIARISLEGKVEFEE